MIAIDTSSLIAFLGGEDGADVEACTEAFRSKQVVFPPVVISEIFSDPELSNVVRKLLRQIPVLSLSPGYWERAGVLRSKVLRKGLKAHLADTLVAQVCIDHDVVLVTRDGDFSRFVGFGLRLV